MCTMFGVNVSHRHKVTDVSINSYPSQLVPKSSCSCTQYQLVPRSARSRNQLIPMSCRTQRPNPDPNPNRWVQDDMGTSWLRYEFARYELTWIWLDWHPLHVHWILPAVGIKWASWNFYHYCAMSLWHSVPIKTAVFNICYGVHYLYHVLVFCTLKTYVCLWYLRRIWDQQITYYWCMLALCWWCSYWIAHK